MIYDIIITIDTESPEKDKRYQAISLRIEANCRAEALIEANKKLAEMGYGQYNRSSFSMRDAK